MSRRWGFTVAALALGLAGCGEVDEEKISLCRNRATTDSCASCCAEHGFSTGEYRDADKECTCIGRIAATDAELE